MCDCNRPAEQWTVNHSFLQKLPNRILVLLRATIQIRGRPTVSEPVAMVTGADAHLQSSVTAALNNET